MLGWLKGNLYFHDDTLSDVVAEVNRYSDKPFVIQDPKVASRPIFGIGRTDSTRATIEAIAVSFGLELIEEKDQIAIVSSGRIRTPRISTGSVASRDP